MRYLILLLLVGCASEPLTEEEQFQREYDENDRKVHYIKWEKECRAAGMVVYGNNPIKQRLNKDKIPHRWDWSYNTKMERPDLGNSYVCVTRDQLRSILGI